MCEKIRKILGMGAVSEKTESQILPISALILVKNSEKTLKACLESLDFVDEILVIDSGSEDKSPDIAQSFPRVRMLKTQWQGYSKTKQWGVTHASHVWILWIDSDETVSKPMKRDIQKSPVWTQDTGIFYAHSFPRKNYVLGQWVRHAGWYPDRVTRLFHKERAGFDDRVLHESIQPFALLKGQGGQDLQHTPRVLECAGWIEHAAYDSWEQYFFKMMHYGDLGAQELLRQKRRFHPLSILLYPVGFFLKSYFLKKGFLDGTLGLILSLGNGFSMFIRYCFFFQHSRLKKDVE